MASRLGLSQFTTSNMPTLGQRFLGLPGEKPPVVEKGTGGDLCRFAPGGALGQALCQQGKKVVDKVIDRIVPGDRGGITNTDPVQDRATSYGGTTATKCPPGYTPDAKGGCRKVGLEGTIERALPGGDTGYAWSSAVGAFGKPALIPVMETREHARCPRRYVLGMDGLCYPKGSISKQERRWVPGTKPMLTGGDVKALNKASSLQKRLKSYQSKYAPRPKACGCKTKRKS